MKRYCKKVDITNVEFIERCAYDYLDGKWNRNDVASLFVRFSDYSFRQIKGMVGNWDKADLFPAVTKISEYISECIKDRKLELKPIEYHTRIDGMSRKERIIGVQEPLHQIFDYVAVEGMRDLLDAKIGTFQCASLPGKGQNYGKKHMERWVEEKDTVYYIQGDIKKCFPSIPRKRLKELLARDIKNDTVLWLVCELIDMFGKAHNLRLGSRHSKLYRFVEATEYGISIGSYLSQYLSNYYISYAYHYACSEALFKVRKTKGSGDVKVRLINHVLFYMDDFTITGTAKKHITMAMKRIVKFMQEFLGLTVKPNWKVCRVGDDEPIDMMGFVFSKAKTIIRAKIFLKARRYFLEARKCLKQGITIPKRLAYQCVSGYGWFKNTDSFKVRQKFGMDEIHKICRKTIGYYARLERGDLSAVIA
jgi:RNA-directed DNA polymerase